MSDINVTSGGKNGVRKYTVSDALWPGEDITITINPAPPPPPVPIPPVALGAWTPPGNASPWNGATAQRYTDVFGQVPGAINYYQDMVHSPTANLAQLREILRAGSLPHISHEIDDYTGGAVQPAYSNAAIIRGDHDKEFEAWFTMLASLGEPLLVRPFWEMTGRWYAWAAGCNGNSPESFIAAWRHYANIAHATAPLVKLVWCPSVEIPTGGLKPFEDCYPGDLHVDVLSLDGYNKSNAPGNSNLGGTWLSFLEVFKPSYDRMVKLCPTKPIIISEVGCHVGAQRPSWISAIPQALLSMPGIVGLIWWNNWLTNSLDCRLETDPATLAAWKALVADPRMQGNLLSRLNEKR